jgi:hypothetical protein
VPFFHQPAAHARDCARDDLVQPRGAEGLNLAAARLRHIAGTQWSTRKYMNMALLRAAQNEAYGAAIA